MTPTPQGEGGTALQRKFTICADHKNAEWNQPQLEDGDCVLCHLFYLEAQESLLEEWQQRAKRAEETIAEIERPLDSQMARLNQTVGRLNEELAAKERELQQARGEAQAILHWLDNNTTFYNVDADWPVDAPNVPVLAQVSERIWYHATDDIQSYPFSEVIKRDLKHSPASGEQINADAAAKEADR